MKPPLGPLWSGVGEPADTDRLTSPLFAQYLGVLTDTFESYRSRGRKARAAGRDRRGLPPEPDGHEPLSGTAWWWGSTARKFKADRPGQGSKAHL